MAKNNVESPETFLNGVLSFINWTEEWAWPRSFLLGQRKNTASPDMSPREDDPTCALSFIELPPKIARDKNLLF